MKWISVKDRLPQDPESFPEIKTYLICEIGGVSFGNYRGYGRWYDPGSDFRLEPSHWMPLPETLEDEPS